MGKILLIAMIIVITIAAVLMIIFRRRFGVDAYKFHMKWYGFSFFNIKEHEVSYLLGGILFFVAGIIAFFKEVFGVNLVGLVTNAFK